MWRWRPTYKTYVGTQFSIHGVESQECPRSLLEHVDKQAATLVGIYNRSKDTQRLGIQTSAASLAIPLVDALVVMTGADRDYEAALAEWNHHDEKNKAR